MHGECRAMLHRQKHLPNANSSTRIFSRLFAHNDKESRNAASCVKKNNNKFTRRWLFFSAVIFRIIISTEIYGKTRREFEADPRLIARDLPERKEGDFRAAPSHTFHPSSSVTNSSKRNRLLLSNGLSRCIDHRYNARRYVFTFPDSIPPSLSLSDSRTEISLVFPSYLLDNRGGTRIWNPLHILPDTN